MAKHPETQIYYASQYFGDRLFTYFYSDQGLVFTTFQLEAVPLFKARFSYVSDPQAGEYPAADDQFARYFSGRQKQVDLPVDWHFLSLSSFRQEVLLALQTVTHKISYIELAEKIGRRQAVRAVATAVAQNPVEIVIACHRIVHKSGDLGQYRDGVSIKRALLELEEGLDEITSRENY